MPQDMPPSGGYDNVQYKRNIIPLSFKPRYWLLGMGAIMVYGWYKLIPGLREYNELAREKLWSRIYLVPAMQAEEDRDQARRYFADQERERALLGTNKSPYNSNRFVRPTFSFGPEKAVPEKKK